MSHAKPQSPSRWTRSKTLLVTTLVGWVPLPIGVKLRNLLYRSIFQQTGKSVCIQPDVEFTDACCLDVGDEVTICRGVFINTRGNSRISLGNQVHIERDVRIECTTGSGKVDIRDNVRLDRGVDIKVHKEGQTEIGDRTYIGPYTCLSGYGHIKIGKDCLIASHSAIYAHNYNFADPTQKIKEQGYNYKGIAIEDDCWLGSGVRVLDGVTIGQGSVIGAGAVVTKDIPPYSVAVGVPAKIVSRRSRAALSIDEKCLESKIVPNNSIDISINL